MIPSPMLLPRFDFQAPGSLAEACDLLAASNGNARLMAGGTDLLVKMKRGTLVTPLVISLGRLTSLVEVDREEGKLRLGSCSTMARLAADPMIREGWQALAEGAASVGGPLVRNRATVGGNIVNARPCADTVPPLIALGARITLQSSRADRVAELDGFLTSPGRCNIKGDEILTRIEIPPPPPHSGSRYIKITRRAAMEVTIVGCAASVVLDDTKSRVVTARLVFTSVAPVPFRVVSAENIIVGHRPTMAVIEEAAREARRLAPAIGDHRAAQDYRLQMVTVTARRALVSAIERAGGRVS